MTDLPSIHDAFVCEPDCPWCLGDGMVCEDHTDRPAFHDGCHAAGMPCRDGNWFPCVYPERPFNDRTMFHVIGHCFACELAIKANEMQGEQHPRIKCWVYPL